MFTIAILLFFLGFQNTYGQFGGGGFGGFGGGFNGYGCGSYVPTLGYECYQPETGKATVACASKYNQHYFNDTYLVLGSPIRANSLIFLSFFQPLDLQYTQMHHFLVTITHIKLLMVSYHLETPGFTILIWNHIPGLEFS